MCSNAALDVSPTTGVLAYPAGYVHNNNKNCSTFSFLAIETCDISIFHSIRAIDFYVSIEHWKKQFGNKKKHIPSIRYWVKSERDNVDLLETKFSH